MSKKMGKAASARGQKVTKTKSAGTKVASRWVVAVDPYSDFDFAPVAQYMKNMAAQAGAKIYATFVLAPESLNWMGEFSGPWLKRYKPVAESKAKELSSQLGLDIEVITSRRAGLRQSADTLIKYAKKIKADRLVITTHGRSGVERWVLGSYAETVLLSSPIPVWVVNPAQTLPVKLDRILVPTDLSSSAGKFIQRAAAVAREFEAKLDLFYKQPDPLDPMIQQGVYAIGGGWVSVQNYLEDNVRDMRLKLEKFANDLKKTDVEAEAIVTSTTENLVDAIEDCAKERHADLIVVQTQTGPIAATLLGSVARALVRTSPVPVLIFR